jgi:hypothetical protein
VAHHGCDGSSSELGSLVAPMISLHRGLDQKRAGEKGILTVGFTSGGDDQKVACDSGVMCATFGNGTRSFSCLVRFGTGSYSGVGARRWPALG